MLRVSFLTQDVAGKMLDWLRRQGLERDELQEQLAIQLMQAAAAEIIRGEPDDVFLAQFVAKQSWSKAEIRQRLTHLVALLNGFRDNRLRDSAIKIAQRMIGELD